MPPNNFVRRLVVHLIPIAVAMAAFSLLAESIRTGQISVFVGLGVIAAAYLVGCIFLVIAIAAMTATPPSQWTALLRQLFRGQN